MKEFAIVAAIFLFAACGSNNSQEKQTEEAPQTQDSTIDARRSTSELAKLMRSIYIDMFENKEQVAKGSMPDIDWGRYAHIKEAQPTDPDDSGPAFDAFADAYVFQLNAFNNSVDSNRIEKYNNLVIGCLNCHQQYCIGPMDIIRTLEIKQ